MPNPGDIVSGKYRILDALGAGAMGIVYAAMHIETEKQLALKWLNPAISRVAGSAERFKREARATGRIHHPNVVAVHDCGEHEGQLYLVMELLQGRTLRAKLAESEGARLGLDEALGLLFPIMRGVAAAHAVGVLHRDLKPENVLLTDSPDGLEPGLKVLDFGLAKLRTDASLVTQLSMPGSLLGTYQYMAPEQLRPRGDLDERVDVFALGAILYEMLIGRPPYCADNPIDLALQVFDSEAPLLSSHDPALPAELTSVVARSLSRDRDTRYASVEDFAVMLEPFTDAHRFRGRAHSDSRRPAPAPLPEPRPGSVTQRLESHGRREAMSLMVPAAKGGRVQAAKPRRAFAWGLVGLGLALCWLLLGPATFRPPQQTLTPTRLEPVVIAPELVPEPQLVEPPSDWAAAPDPTASAPRPQPPPAAFDPDPPPPRKQRSEPVRIKALRPAPEHTAGDAMRAADF